MSTQLNTLNAINEAQESKLITHEMRKKEATCCGRKITRCNCISLNTFFTITSIVGSVLLILGVLALAGHFAPTTGGSFIAFLQKINHAATFVASNLGSDLFTLAMFSASFGTAFTFTGVVGLIINRCDQPKTDKKKKIEFDQL